MSKDGYSQYFVLQRLGFKEYFQAVYFILNLFRLRVKHTYFNEY